MEKDASLHNFELHAFRAAFQMVCYLHNRLTHFSFLYLLIYADVALSYYVGAFKIFFRDFECKSYCRATRKSFTPQTTDVSVH